MEWNPTQFFQVAPPPIPYAILVLNQPINQNAYSVLKKHACFTICADGGANRYYELMKSKGLEDVELPDAIVGDLDSIHAQVRKHYEDLNVKVIEDPEQYSTDFMKCISYLHSNCNNIVAKSATAVDEGSRGLDIVVLSGLGGRVDQGFSQVHYLYTISRSPSTVDSRPDGELYLVSEESITFVLREGRNTIFTPGGSTLAPPEASSKGLDSQGRGEAIGNKLCLSENVGIIPVGRPSVINTRGLEWDVSDWKTEFGGQFSTSNHIRADVIEIDTTVPVLFTAELAPWLKLDNDA